MSVCLAGLGAARHARRVLTEPNGLSRLVRFAPQAGPRVAVPSPTSVEATILRNETGRLPAKPEADRYADNCKAIFSVMNQFLTVRTIRINRQ